MSPPVRARALAVPSFPRVSGDEPPLVAVPSALVMFSPRERG